MKGAEQYSICSYNGQQGDRHLHSDPTVAAVKRLICGLDGSGPGRHAWPKSHITKHKAGLWFTSIAREIAARKVWSLQLCYQGGGDIWMWMTENDREKMEGRDEYLNVRSKNNNDSSLHWHAV